MKGGYTMKKFMFMIALGLMVTWTSSSAQAHILWLNASNYSPKPGETIWLEVGFGHHYPRDEVMKEGRLERVYALGLDGQEWAVEKIFPSFYKFTPTSEGTYRIIAVLKSGFVSKTTDGRKLGNKKDLSDVVSCFAYRITAKAVVRCGTRDQGLSEKAMNALEIMPLKDSTRLKTGDTLRLKLLFQGKPLAGATLKADCADCSNDKGPSWAQEVISDANGIATIQLSNQGDWMFTVSHKIPYTDPNLCDEFSYCTSLTLGL